SHPGDQLRRSGEVADASHSRRLRGWIGACGGGARIGRTDEVPPTAVPGARGATRGTRIGSRVVRALRATVSPDCARGGAARARARRRLASEGAHRMLVKGMATGESSFDVVSQFDRQELVNAVDQALREVHTRFDLKDSGTTIELEGSVLKLHSASEMTLDATRDVLR